MANNDEQPKNSSPFEREPNEPGDTLGRFEAIMLQHWRELAGPLLDEMLANQQAAERSLEDSDPRVRVAALNVLEERWKPAIGSDCLRRVFAMATGDADEQVRSIAASCLAACHAATDDVPVGRLLAQMVLDESAKVSSRALAYSSLHTLRGLAPPEVTQLARKLGERPRFPDYIDWSFVRSFLDEKRIPSSVDPREEQLASLGEPLRTAFRFYRDAEYAFRRSDHEGALAAATASLRLSPDRVASYILRAEIYLRLSRPDDAIADLTKAIELDPSEAKAYRLRSRAYELMGDPKRAREDIRRAQEIRQ